MKDIIIGMLFAVAIIIFAVSAIWINIFSSSNVEDKDEE